MRLIFWNIRAGGGYRAPEILEQLEAWQPDVIALAEFRGTPASTELKNQLSALGFKHQLDTTNSEKLPMNALLLASNYPVEPIELAEAPQEPCRWLLASVMGKRPFTLGIMHVPNRVTKRKYPFHDAVLEVVANWKLGPGLLIGDTNTGLPDLDGSVGTFSKEEIQWMNSLDGANWKDALRYLYGEKRVYTWYSHKNNGFRLDEAFVNPQLLPALIDIAHEWGHSPTAPERRDALSDHAALLLDFHDELIG